MNEIETNIHMKIEELSVNGILKNSRLFLFGCNMFTECIINFLHDEGYMLHRIIDNDIRKQGKNLHDIQIVSPIAINWMYGDIVLIASEHVKSMTEQVQKLSREAEVISLLDYIECQKKEEESNKFWMEENYTTEIEKLYRGYEIYKKIKTKEESLIIFPASSLGDIFIVALYLDEYKKTIENNVKVVVLSKGSYRAAMLFNINNIVAISEREMNDLRRFVIFSNLKKDLICDWVAALFIMAAYKRITFPKYWVKYFLKLGNNYQMHFPSIWDANVSETDLVNKGLSKGRTVIIAPYADSINELPTLFWESLVKVLSGRNFCIFTNVIGNQKPINGSRRLEIPLHQMGTYLEFSGFFISLRSGLCDVVGRSRCKKIIIFRKQEFACFSSLIEFFDLHSEGISENAIQFSYENDTVKENVDRVMDFLSGKKVE